jgi:hypothetical protein
VAHPADASTAPTAVRSNAATRRAAHFYPQPTFAVVSPEIQAVFGEFYNALTNNCLRNIGFRHFPEPMKNMCRCFEDQCRKNHLDRDVRFCNDFKTYLETHWVSGLDMVEIVQTCRRSKCMFWPCNQLPYKRAILSRVAELEAAEHAKKAAEHAKTIPTAVADPLIVCLQQNKQECFISAEKLAMRVSDPELHSVWALPRYTSLVESEFQKCLNLDYLAWNCVGVSLVRGAKLDEDDDEWAQDDAEVLDADHRLEFADFIASLRCVSLSEDRRVIGSQAAMLVAETNGDVFGEYTRACWNFDGRPMRLRRGDVPTFNDWLNSHSKYSTIYQLIKSGKSWSGAKKALCGVRTMPIVEEACDWDAMTLCPCAAEDVCGQDSALSKQLYDLSKQLYDSMQKEVKSVSSRAALDTIVEEHKTKTWKEARSILKNGAAPIAHELRNTGKQGNEIPIVPGPSYLAGRSQCMFVERNTQGFFAIHLKLAVVKPSQEELRAILDLWSRFRVGPGRASFVAAGDSLFLKIEGSIKDAQGFHHMFEKFPSFIAALRRREYMVGENLSAIPVERLSTSAEDVELGSKILLTGVEEAESDDDEDCGFSFDPSVKCAASADTGAVKYKGRINAYELCDIIVMYMKK